MKVNNIYVKTDGTDMAESPSLALTVQAWQPDFETLDRCRFFVELKVLPFQQSWSYLEVTGQVAPILLKLKNQRDKDVAAAIRDTLKV